MKTPLSSEHFSQILTNSISILSSSSMKSNLRQFYCVHHFPSSSKYLSNFILYKLSSSIFTTWVHSNIHTSARFCIWAIPFLNFGPFLAYLSDFLFSWNSSAYCPGFFFIVSQRLWKRASVSILVSDSFRAQLAYLTYLICWKWGFPFTLSSKFQRSKLGTSLFFGNRL